MYSLEKDRDQTTDREEGGGSANQAGLGGCPVLESLRRKGKI
jgi:hypothetical protein